MQPIDFDAARQFIAALGKPKGSIRLRGFYAKNDPRKSKDGGRKGEPAKATIQLWVADRRGVYVVVNNGGDRDADITECIALFIEWDDKPKDWQVTAWREFGLPQPSLQVDTGGKSIHNYWILSTPVAPDEWRPVQSHLIDCTESDSQLKNPARVMRLPGMPHGETGVLATIIHSSDARYTLEDIAACLPEPPPEPEPQPEPELAPDPRSQQARTFTDYEVQGLDEIQRALQAIPQRVPGAGTYPMYRNILWGLISAVEEAGSSRDIAISMMVAHSPQWSGIEQVAGSGGADVGAGTFWYWAKEHGYHQPRSIRSGPPELRQTDAEIPADTLPFRPLGFDHGIYYYLPRAACQVTSLTASQHNSSHFLQLAPLEWWLAGFGDERGRIDWTSAQNAVMGACIAQGVYDPARIRGRGTWFDADRVILHLGNRLVIDGRSRPITKLPADFQSYYFYENAKAIEGPGTDRLADKACTAIKSIAESFRWETPASANLLLGWIVLAPVCGALKWRPHIWITGGAGSGKTTILRDFMKPMLGGMFEGATGGTTEAGLRGQLRSDAIPVVFDELEQNEQKDKQVVQNILALARIASSEGGKIYKGTTNGGSNTFEIRSMFCVSSINVALVQRADLDRFCVLALSRDQMGKDDWNKLEQRLLETCTEDNGRMLLARTLKQVPAIRKNAKTIAAALARRFGQRFGDQYGTLLAGAWTLEPHGGGELTLDQAREWIDGMEWDSREIDSNDADEVKCLNHILQFLVSVAGGRRVSVLEMIQLSLRGVKRLDDKDGEEIASVLGRYGIKVFDDSIAISNSSTNLQAVLRDTPWSGGAYRQALKRVDGATGSSGTIRFPGCGATRATLVPLESLKIE
jgi:hypothetical protein